jgi:hypothetical protein
MWMKAKVGLVGRLAAGVAFAAALVAAAPASAAAGSAVIGGRIVFRDATREARAEEVERLRWGHIVVEVRHGLEVFSAQPDGNGMFTITGPPGEYRLEYVRIGQLAEFFAPHEVVAAADGVTCLGTIVVTVDNLAQDLGNNKSSRIEVRGDCAVLAPELGRLASAATGGAGDGAGTGASAVVKASLPRPVAKPTWTPHPMEVLVAFRGAVSLATDSKASSLRVDFVLPLFDPHHGQWLVGASLLNVPQHFIDYRWPMPIGGPAAHSVWGGAIGGGYTYWAFEAMVWGGATGDPGRGAHGPFGAASLRFGSFLWGFGGRIDYFPGTGDQINSFMIDLSPFALLGSLL